MKNKKLLAAFVVVITIALSLTLYLLQRQQEIRSRATGETVSLRLTPETAPAVPVGTAFPVEVSLANSGYDITGVDITIQYDREHLEITNRTPASTFADTLLNTIEPSIGSIRFVAVNSTTTPITTASIPVLTLTVRGRAAGVGTIGFTNTEIVAVNNNTFLPIGTNATGNYTIGTAASPTAPATSPTLTLTPTPTLTPIPSQPTAEPSPPSATLTPLPTTSTCHAPATRQTGDADNDNCATVGDFIVWKFEFIEEAAGRTTARQSNFDDDDRISVGDFIIWKNTFINGQ